jgi:hypothetical protein
MPSYRIKNERFFCYFGAPGGGDLASLARRRAAQPKVGNAVCLHMDETPDLTQIDLHGYGPRLRKIAIAAVIGAVLTLFAVKGMTSSGRGPNTDPVGMGSVIMVAIAMFVVTTAFAHKILSKKRALR